MRKIIFTTLCILLLTGYANAKKTEVDYLNEAQKLANAELKRNPAYANPINTELTWNYKLTFLSNAILKLYEATGDSVYFNVAKSVADYFLTDDNGVKTYDASLYDMHDLQGGSFIYNVYLQNGGGREYLRQMTTLRRQFYKQPRTPSRVFAVSQELSNQVSLEELMAFPFYTTYGVIFDESAILNDVALQLVAIDKLTKDETTGLNFAAWSVDKTLRWTNGQTGTSSVIFSQSLAWYMVAIIDVLEYFPINHDMRLNLMDILYRVSTSLIKYQDKSTGMWYQVTDQPKKAGNFQEASATAMFSYAIAKGARNGYLPKKYRAAAENAFKGLLNNCIENTNGLTLTKSTQTADLSETNGSYDYYVNIPVADNDPIGVAAFILAATELALE